MQHQCLWYKIRSGLLTVAMKKSDKPDNDFIIIRTKNAKEQRSVQESRAAAQ